MNKADRERFQRELKAKSDRARVMVLELEQKTPGITGYFDWRMAEMMRQLSEGRSARITLIASNWRDLCSVIGYARAGLYSHFDNNAAYYALAAGKAVS